MSVAVYETDRMAQTSDAGPRVLWKAQEAGRGAISAAGWIHLSFLKCIV
uniref:Uncharacterized protein n=1 Tax=Anguilla anguilla TaxID=7936 RepID=A0A0E9UWC3_ANGAN